MERKANTIKLNEVKRLSKERQYIKALKILETINIDKIRNMMDLSVIAQVFIGTSHYEDAMEILLRIYEKSCTRRVIEQLICVCIKMKNFEEVDEFYKEYLRIAPRDPYRLILLYTIQKAKHDPYKDRIVTLEQLKHEDYMEEWGYELAKLYHKTGQVDKCVEECSDIILWFGKGIIVEKAKLLKEHYISGINIADTLGQREFDATINLSEVLKKVKENISMETSKEELIQAEDDVNEVHEQLTDQENKVQESQQLLTSTELEKMKQKIRSLQNEETINMYSPEDEEIIDTGVELYAKGVDLYPIFGHFIKNTSVKEQIISILKNMEKDPACNNFYICGDVQSGKTYLAKAMANALKKLNVISTKKFAKIKADKLNEVSLDDKWDQLEGGAIVIEDAGSLTEKTIESLIKMIQHFDGRVLVFLEDSTRRIQEIALNSGLDKYFKHRIIIPQYEEQDYYEYVQSLIKEQEYLISQDAIQLVMKKTDKLVRLTSKEHVLVEMAKFVEQMISKAEIRNTKVLVEQAKDGNFEKKIDKVITKDDF